jgi:diguanylate cyclase (GGDEF)-like protein
LTTLRAVAALSNAQASQHLPVSFEATVIYYRGSGRELFVQDGDAAIYVYNPQALHLVPGDRILVKGAAHESFRPFIASSEVTVVGHGALPKPVPATYEQMIRGETDCRLVVVRALIRSADIVPGANAPLPGIRLRVLVDGGSVDVDVSDGDESRLKDLLDTEVEITGAASGHFDNKMEQTGILLHVAALNSIKILKRADTDPWSQPITPIDRVITGYHIVDETQRMRIRGTLTYYQPGSALVLQDGNRSLWVSTGTYEPLHLGDEAEVTGFPDVQSGFLTLTRAEVKDKMIAKPVAPKLFTWRELAAGGNAGQGHGFDLVTIEGQVVAEVREATQDGYVLSAEGHLVSAIFSHPGETWEQSSESQEPLKQLPIGARVRVTGICILSNPNPFNGDVAFDILMRSYDDIAVVARPSPLNVRNLIVLVALLLVVVFAVGAWSWYLERKRRQETAALAYLERRRSLVLEEVNNSCPLNEIIGHVTELVSYKLRGASSWCEIVDGASFGQRPATITSQRVVQQEIRGRSGAYLGTLFAAIPRFVKPSADESAALALGAGLAKLAIETSNLYHDLVYRSEFDLLTDIPNRFSLEKQLETRIQEACACAGVFGFIFIDLDRFKQVNDRYGHQVGDLYLQAVAQRMKRQLRPGDMLARLGGDEFAVVAPAVRNRMEVEEIALRLERCFDEPFAAEGRLVYGSASMGIALYPEDANNRDGLLTTADAAMYACKESRKSAGIHAPGDAAPDPAAMRCA